MFRHPSLSYRNRHCVPILLGTPPHSNGGVERGAGEGSESSRLCLREKAVRSRRRVISVASALRSECVPNIRASKPNLLIQ